MSNEPNYTPGDLQEAFIAAVQKIIETPGAEIEDPVFEGELEARVYEVLVPNRNPKGTAGRLNLFDVDADEVLVQAVIYRHRSKIIGAELSYSEADPSSNEPAWVPFAAQRPGESPRLLNDIGDDLLKAYIPGFTDRIGCVGEIKNNGMPWLQQIAKRTLTPA